MPEYKAKVEEKDGGYYFPDFDIHVVAESLEEAKQKIKDGHGVDVDKNPSEVEGEE